MDDYEIMRNGDIVSHKYRQPRTMKPYLSRFGYPLLTLSHKNVKTRHLVHRLVAMEHISNIDNKPEVNHIDGNKQNNHVDNLEWVTSKENMSHASKAGLLSNPRPHKRKIAPLERLTVRALNTCGCTQDLLAQQYGVSQHLIWKIINSTESITNRTECRNGVT